MADWRLNKPSKGRIQYLLENEIGTDVTFNFASGDAVKAHKFMLIYASPVFERIILNDNKDDNIILHDENVDIFKQILRFIYIDQLNASAGNVVKLMVAAEKYKLPLLIQTCNAQLRNLLDAENVFLLLERAVEFSLMEVKEQCLRWIEDHTKVALNSTQFLKINADVLDLVLQCDQLDIPEYELYSYCKRWAEEKLAAKQEAPTGINIREELGCALYRIRFPVMEIQAFSSISGSGILRAEEELILFRHITMPTREGYDLKFPQRKRQARQIPLSQFPTRRNPTMGNANINGVFHNVSYMGYAAIPRK